MDAVRGFISALMSAVSNCSLYSREHTAVTELAGKSLSILEELLEEKGTVEMMIVENDLIVNRSPLAEIGLQEWNLVKRLKRKGISRIDFLKGITLRDLMQFISDIASPDEKMAVVPNIRTGIIDVKIGGLKFDGYFDTESMSNFTLEQIERIKEIYHGISPFKRLNVAGLEEIVVNFIITFRKEVNILKLISPVQSYSEYTYTHATNVAVLSMFQAETLGMRDDLLRDIGMAALLHDVGKLFISKEILDKKGSLDEGEWEEIKLHPLYGARYLAKLENIPRLATIVAFEHHLRYDGRGYPRQHVAGKIQHICSQTVAISDFFDALRSKRPYRRELEIKEVLSIMKKETKGTFNPLLLDNFIKSIQMAMSE
ncbi:MAG: HD domain-containing phosphohydrolase [Nitrospirota bacterium]